MSVVGSSTSSKSVDKPERLLGEKRKTRSVSRSLFDYLHHGIVSHFTGTPSESLDSPPATDNSDSTNGQQSTSSKSPQSFLGYRYSIPADFEFPFPLPTSIANLKLDSLLEQWAYYKLESIGFQSGRRLLSLLVLNKSKRFGGVLETIKYICRDFWILLYNHQVETIRTNPSRSVFVIVDPDYPPLIQLQGFFDDPRIHQFLAYHVGLLRGAFSALDLDSEILYETKPPHLISFRVERKLSKASDIVKKSSPSSISASNSPSPSASSASQKN